jgi:hypothetical protein
MIEKKIRAKISPSFFITAPNEVGDPEESSTD